MVKNRSSTSAKAVKPLVKAEVTIRHIATGRRSSARLDHKTGLDAEEVSSDSSESTDRSEEVPFIEGTSETSTLSSGLEERLKEFIRIEQGPIDFRCCLSDCCDSVQEFRRGYTVRSDVGVILNDEGEEVLVIPEMTCPASGIAHTSYEIMEGSTVELSIPSDDVLSSPITPFTPLTLDFEAFGSYDEKSAAQPGCENVLEAWIRDEESLEELVDPQAQNAREVTKEERGELSLKVDTSHYLYYVEG